MTKLTNENKALIEDMIIQADIETQIDIFNYYCDICNLEERLWSMEDINELCTGMKATEIIGLLGQNFRLNDDWFYTDAYGNLISTDRPYSDLIHYYVSDIAEMIWYDHSDMDNSYIRENMYHDGLWDRQVAD